MMAVQHEPFAPVAELERLNEALREDCSALCEQLADKCGLIARLEQEVAQLKRQRGLYSIQQPEDSVVRYRVRGER